jgi:hypothetical protein
MIKDYDPAKTEQYHLVTQAEYQKFFGNKTPYMYLFEFHPFAAPIPYEKQAGQRTFVPKVEFDTKSTSPNLNQEFKEAPQKMGTMAPAFLSKEQVGYGQPPGYSKQV